jgi:hypothetical protein
MVASPNLEKYLLNLLLSPKERWDVDTAFFHLWNATTLHASLAIPG